MKKEILALTTLLPIFCLFNFNLSHADTKWVQLPNMGPGICSECHNGFPYETGDWQSIHLAGPNVVDDFLCDNPDPIIGICWWGSYLDGLPVEPGTKLFKISFHWSDPTGGCLPEPGPMWMLFPASETYYGTTQDGEDVYYYCISSADFEPFPQWEGGPYIWWIDIAYANEDQRMWGWHESNTQWNCPAVQSYPPYNYGDPQEGPWNMLYIEELMVDMAFELYIADQPTMYPVYTECPQVYTECPATPTECVEVQTECPVIETECADIPTWCPEIPTYCPKEPLTQCPLEYTICPEEPTWCPTDWTYCPDWGPTWCPEFFTECPMVPTECFLLDTECSFITTQCPIEFTWCPLDPTYCPDDYVPTWCYFEPTICPYEETICPTEYTLCPENPTWCPKDITNCPMEWTTCPSPIPTACPVDLTICGPTVDTDGDGADDCSDNCPNHPNGPLGGTCTKGNHGASCTAPGPNVAECGTNGYCSMNQEDTYPPGGNGCGDACECEGNFDDDQDQDGTDAAKFKADFGRSPFNRPCTNGDPCNGDFDCDVDVDGTDAALFKSDFGRSTFFNPCPYCPTDPWCTYP